MRIEFRGQRSEHLGQSGESRAVALVVDAVDLLQSHGNGGQFPPQILVMRGDDMIGQIVEAGLIPVDIRGFGGLAGGTQFRFDASGIQPFFAADIGQRPFAATAVIDSPFLKYPNSGQRMGSNLGDGSCG